MSHASETCFSLLIPEFIGVVLFLDVIKIAVFTHDPTAVDAEGELVPITGSLFAPHLGIARRYTYSSAVAKVNTNSDGFVIVVTDEGDRLTILEVVKLSFAQMDIL